MNKHALNLKIAANTIKEVGSVIIPPDLLAAREYILKAEKLLRDAGCPDPNCDGQGVTVFETTRIEPVCCYQPTETGDCCGMPVPEQVPDLDQAPCQWCADKKQLLEEGTL